MTKEYFKHRKQELLVKLKQDVNQKKYDDGRIVLGCLLELAYTARYSDGIITQNEYSIVCDAAADAFFK